MNAKPKPVLAFDYKHTRIGQSLLVHADAFEWLSRLPSESLDGMVFDPPYGVKEYELDQIERMLTGGAGIWRIPPTFDGSQRAPLPRFTALVEEERSTLHRFFRDVAIAALPALKPGAHVFTHDIGKHSAWVWIYCERCLHHGNRHRQARGSGHAVTAELNE